MFHLFFFCILGDKLRVDLRKKDVPPPKMSALEQKFEEVRNNNQLLPSANTTSLGNDEADNAAMPRPTKMIKRTVSATPRKLGEVSQASSSLNSDVAAGAVSQEVFEAAFEQVPVLNIFTQRDMDDQFKQIEVSVGDKNMQWEKRVDAVGALLHKIFITYIDKVE